MNIFPSYNCNMQCDFCHLYQKISTELMSLDWFEKELKEHPDLCDELTIMGGEPSLLPREYQERLVDICTKAQGCPPYYTTNLLKITEVADKVKLIVSYDFNIRKYSHIVLNNIFRLEKPFIISTIMTNNLVNMGAGKFIKFIEKIKNCEKVHLLIYIGGLTVKDFTPDTNKLIDFIKEVIHHPKVMIAQYAALKNNINLSFDNMAAYIGMIPTNQYRLYTESKYTRENTAYDTYEEVREQYLKEINDIKSYEPCKSCEYRNYCWSENGFIKGECTGFKEILKTLKEI